MKRFAAVVLIICLSFSMLTGCNDTPEERVDNSVMREEILNEFSEIAQIPRASGHEKAMSAYLKNWAKVNGFKVVRDSFNNVIIEKPASDGYENAPITILQCNIDTSIAVTDDVIFDPLVDPVQFVQNEDKLTGEGTSIGADSGIGMSTILYVLKNAQNHGLIRAIFTTFGESGMQGAEKLNEKYLEGKFLINLAWNSNRAIGVGSGGTASYKMIRSIKWTQPKNEVPYLLSIKGLTGGDSIENVGKSEVNAIKILGEVLANAQGQGILFELASFNGGGAGDTIPDAADALIIINKSDVRKMRSVVNSAMNTFRNAYGSTETNYSFDYQESEMPDKVISFDDNGCIVSFFYGIVNGIQSMSKTYDGVVESASNLGKVSTSSGDFICQTSAFSTSEVGLYKISNAHETISNMCGLSYEYSEGVPIWPVHTDSVLYDKIYEICFGMYNKNMIDEIKQGKHECGWFAKKNPKLQIVSIGPMIENVNSPDEALILDSITEPANIILSFLKQMKPIESYEAVKS
ncbi:MAG: M20/M25/M40 family metallo-hydrolase [Eubacteriales bacterium]|nr:M20/M25/M40 family metallo-hydrolase [Eubacteriales bacterium]